MYNSYCYHSQEELKILDALSQYKEKYNHAGIYCICVNNKVIYVGKSKNMLDRIEQHIHQMMLQFPKESKYIVLQGLRERGYSITFEVLEYADAADLKEREAFWINYYMPTLNTQIPRHKDFKKQKRIKLEKIEDVLKLAKEKQ